MQQQRPNPATEHRPPYPVPPMLRNEDVLRLFTHPTPSEKQRRADAQAAGARRARVMEKARQELKALQRRGGNLDRQIKLEVVIEGMSKGHI